MVKKMEEEINSVIVRYGEIGTKGKNRGYFEKRLIRNIKDCLSKNNIKFSKIQRYSGRIIIFTSDKCLPLKYVFGITSFSPAIKAELDLEKIKNIALKLYEKGTFRISAKRLNQKFNYSSEQLNIEIMNYAYLFNIRYEALGGLPVHSEGLVTLILDSEKSLLAGILMLKRGCSLEIIKEKDIDHKILEKYSYGSKINIVNKPSQESKAIVKVEDLKDLKSKLYNLPVFNP